MGRNGNGRHPAPDPIGAAVAAADAKQIIQMTVMEGGFGESGRPFKLAVPDDISEAEAYALIELITRLRQQASATEARRPRLFVPG